MTLLLLAGAAQADITRLISTNKVVALTFDACETKTPAYFDQSIVGYLTNQKIPFTVFVSGKFARRNAEELKVLSGFKFAEFENHSMNHSKRMTNMGPVRLTSEVASNADLIEKITGRKPVFFRFPYGFSNDRTVAAVEKMGYRVVRWSFASGDPDPKIPAWKILQEAVLLTKPGSILIFHINGRGWHTGEVLPKLVKQLRKKGYTFVRLEDGLR